MLLKGHQSEVAQNEKNASFCRMIRKDRVGLTGLKKMLKRLNGNYELSPPGRGFTALVLMEKGFSCWNLKWLMRIRNPVMSSRV